MLAPDDRAVLREQLRPEPGTRLDYAIGTTFTLDLTAAVVIPLAFAAQSMSSSADPIAVLEAIRSAANRVDVFCQAGHIRVPGTPSDLAAFLEPMIHEVRAPRPGFLFHPKVWVAKYADADDFASYRLLCGTRNLTNDVSWDILVRLDGAIETRRPKTQNRQLVEFIRALPGLSIRDLDADRNARVNALADEIATVEWDPVPDLGNASLDFHALGLRTTRGVPPIVNALAGRRHLIVSPFLDDAGIAAITRGSSEVQVVSRVEALERLSLPTVEEIDARVVSSLAALEQRDDADDTEGSGQGVLGGLHAKFYVVEAARQAALFIGSANATSAGLLGGNVEFMLEFRGGPKYMGIEQFTGDKAGFRALLEDYTPTGGSEASLEESLGRDLESYLRHVAEHSLVGTVTENANTWAIAVSSATALNVPAESVELQIALLTNPTSSRRLAGGHVAALFDQLSITEITPFVVFRATAKQGSVTIERSTVVRARLVGDPPQRFDEIIAKQFKSTEDFLRFLALLLGLADGFLAVGVEGEGLGGVWKFGAGGAGLFEMLIRAVAERPDAIGDLDRLIQRLEQTEQGKTVLPAGFADLWAVIREAHDHSTVPR